MNDYSRSESTVYIVEDDAALRDSLSLVLGILGYRTAMFESAETFLRALQDDWEGCVVADLRLPGMSGLDLQAKLRAMGSALSFVIITGHGDVKLARAAFHSDAVDFIEKPFEEADLLAAIGRGLERAIRQTQGARAANEQAAQMASLSKRERDVLSLVGKGLHAKEIGASLNISSRTVEVHKSHIMEKLKARTSADLVRFAVLAEKAEPGSG